MIEDSIVAITELLKQLSVNQEKQTAEITALREELREVKQQLSDATDEKKQPDGAKKKGSFSLLSSLKRRAFNIGDKVLITNPNKGQEDIGYIKDYTKNGYPRVQTENQLITRAPKNLRHLE